MKNRRRLQRLDYTIDIPVAVGVNRLPAGTRLGLRAWLRHWRRHPRRVFWSLDPATGHWRRL